MTKKNIRTSYFVPFFPERFLYLPEETYKKTLKELRSSGGGLNDRNLLLKRGKEDKSYCCQFCYFRSSGMPTRSKTEFKTTEEEERAFDTVLNRLLEKSGITLVDKKCLPLQESGLRMMQLEEETRERLKKYCITALRRRTLKSTIRHKVMVGDGQE